MVDNLLKNVVTVGAFIIEKNKFLFSIGPNKECENIGITRLGGHVENDETILEALERELMEEASSKLEVLSSTKCYHKKSWEDTELEEIQINIEGIIPALVVGDDKRTTVLFWGKLKDKPVPSNETKGLIYLPIEAINDLSIIEDNFSKLKSKSFEIILQDKMDNGLKVKAGVHLTALNQMLKIDEVTAFLS